MYRFLIILLLLCNVVFGQVKTIVESSTNKKDILSKGKRELSGQQQIGEASSDLTDIYITYSKIPNSADTTYFMTMFPKGMSFGSESLQFKSENNALSNLYSMMIKTFDIKDKKEIYDAVIELGNSKISMVSLSLFGIRRLGLTYIGEVPSGSTITPRWMDLGQFTKKDINSLFGRK